MKSIEVGLDEPVVCEEQQMSVSSSSYIITDTTSQPQGRPQARNTVTERCVIGSKAEELLSRCPHLHVTRSLCSEPECLISLLGASFETFPSALSPSSSRCMLMRLVLPSAFVHITSSLSIDMKAGLSSGLRPGLELEEDETWSEEGLQVDVPV
ncbi:hypothetical protein RRG08_036005 [Elysia crispata]|uniref:Uncharacterized protein n=1 Tax=Elysia crispata TaxID=231223 RepID=A0AAE1AL13_9GAST|nr:hypothetical protein RRG08_036005 [Elysia crispata]